MTTSPLIPDGVTGIFLWTFTMIFSLLAASSLMAVMLALGWAKEFRLRRALQSLLTRAFTHWRHTHESHPSLSQNRKLSGSGARPGHGRLR